MSRMEVELPDDVADRIAQAGQAEGVAAEDLAGKTACGAFPAQRKLSFVGVGASASGHRAAVDEKLPAEGFGQEHRRADR